MTIRHKTLELIALERLLIRLPEHHPEYKFVSDRVYKLNAGLSGEQTVDYIISEIGLPSDVKIIRDITFEFSPNHFIQLDTLIITKKCIFLLEIKKYAAGTIEFNDHIGKTIRTITGQQAEAFDCVVDQLDRMTHALQIILSRLNIPLPIIPILVLANQNSIVTQAPSSLTWKYAKQLPRFIRSTLNAMNNLNNIQPPLIYKHLHQQAHMPSFIPLCKRFENIDVNDLITGVLCTDCHHPTFSLKRKWYCPICGTVQARALTISLQDWFYLVDLRLTNREARKFLNINCRNKMTYLLVHSKLAKHEKNRAAYYSFPTLIHHESERQ